MTQIVPVHLQIVPKESTSHTQEDVYNANQDFSKNHNTILQFYNYKPNYAHTAKFRDSY